MSRRSLRPLAVASVFAGLALAHGSAQQPKPLQQPLPKIVDPLKTEMFTAFPNITVPTKPHEFAKNPDGTPMLVADEDKLYRRLTAGFPRPIPADAPPLTKVRIAQVNEGAAYVLKVRQVMAAGKWTAADFHELVKLTAEVYRILAELEANPADKAAIYEERVAVFKAVEQFTEKRVEVGADTPQQLNEARFVRLQAEADLIRLKEQLKVK